MPDDSEIQSKVNTSIISLKIGGEDKEVSMIEMEVRNLPDIS
jgi:hypothetical protein